MSLERHTLGGTDRVCPARIHRLKTQLPQPQDAASLGNGAGRKVREDEAIAEPGGDTEGCNAHTRVRAAWTRRARSGHVPGVALAGPLLPLLPSALASWLQSVLCRHGRTVGDLGRKQSAPLPRGLRRTPWTPRTCRACRGRLVGFVSSRFAFKPHSHTVWPGLERAGGSRRLCSGHSCPGPAQRLRLNIQPASILPGRERPGSPGPSEGTCDHERPSRPCGLHGKRGAVVTAAGGAALGRPRPQGPTPPLQPRHSPSHPDASPHVGDTGVLTSAETRASGAGPRKAWCGPAAAQTHTEGRGGGALCCPSHPVTGRSSLAFSTVPWPSQTVAVATILARVAHDSGVDGA